MGTVPSGDSPYKRGERLLLAVEVVELGGLVEDLPDPGAPQADLAAVRVEGDVSRRVPVGRDHEQADRLLGVVPERMRALRAPFEEHGVSGRQPALPARVAERRLARQHDQQLFLDDVPVVRKGLLTGRELVEAGPDLRRTQLATDAEVLPLPAGTLAAVLPVLAEHVHAGAHSSPSQ